MSSSVLDPIKALFSPARPLWACEFTARHVIVAGVESSRRRISGATATSLPAASLAGSLSEKNLLDPQAVFDFTGQTLNKAGYKGFEISVVIPDDSSRIAFLTAESLPGSNDDRESFIRWKLKKTVPFDIDTAQVAYKVIASRATGDDAGVDILVALCPRAIVHEYEELFDKMNLHAGFVIPSTLAAVNLYQAPQGDSIYVKVAPDAITTTVFQNSVPRFYRRVVETSLYDAVYPTILYYQDKLGGSAIGSITVCGYDTDFNTQLSDLRNRSGLPVKRAEPANTDDLFKPALGAAEYR